MLLPGNRIRFFWLEGCLVGVLKRNTVEFSPHAALKPLTFFNFGVLVCILFLFSLTATKCGNLSTKTDLSNPNIRAVRSDPEGRLLKSEPSVSFCCSVSRTSCHLVRRALPPFAFQSKSLCFRCCCMTAQWRQHFLILTCCFGVFFFLLGRWEKRRTDADFLLRFTTNTGWTLRQAEKHSLFLLWNTFLIL